MMAQYPVQAEPGVKRSRPLTKDSDAPRRRIGALRERRPPGPGPALVQISADLDLDVAPREVVDGTRAVTGAARA